MSVDNAATETVHITAADFATAQADCRPAALEGVQLQENADSTLDDVGALAVAKEVLLETMLWPSKYPELFAACPLRMRSGILLYGTRHYP